MPCGVNGVPNSVLKGVPDCVQAKLRDTDDSVIWNDPSSVKVLLVLVNVRSECGIFLPLAVT